MLLNDARTGDPSTVQPMGTFDKESYREVEVAWVDAFQGRENHFLMLFCVRSKSVSSC
jgi:regulator of nonsense transcripts 1